MSTKTCSTTYWTKSSNSVGRAENQLKFKKINEFQGDRAPKNLKFFVLILERKQNLKQWCDSHSEYNDKKV